MSDNKWYQAIPYIGSALSFVNSVFSNDKTKDYINQQFENNVKMWNMQNAYNTPAAQKSRLEAAGFNPMFYGPDGNTAQQLSPVDVSGAANAASTKEQTRLMKEQQALSDAQALANIDLTKAQTAKTEAEKSNVEINTEKQIFNRDNRGWLFDVLNSYWSGNLTASQAVSSMVDTNVKNIKYGVHQFPDSEHGMPSNIVYDYEKGYSLQLDDVKADLWNNAELESILTSNNVNRATQRNLINSMAVALRNIAMLEENSKSQRNKTDAETSLTEFTEEMYKAGLNPNDNVFARWLTNTFGHYFGNVKPDLRTQAEKYHDKRMKTSKNGMHSASGGRF